MLERTHAFPMPAVVPEEQHILDVAVAFFLTPTEASSSALDTALEHSTLVNERVAFLVLQAANAVFDDEARTVMTAVREQGGVVPCHAGCDGCCCHMVLCHPYEAALIAAYLQRSPEHVRAFASAYKKWDATTAPFRASFLVWAERYYGHGEDDGTHAVGDYYVPCVFLQEGQCSIYPVRPYACRSCIALSPTCSTPPTGQRRGMESKDLGACTPHKAARTSALHSVWRLSGVTFANAQPRIMAEQVNERIQRTDCIF